MRDPVAVTRIGVIIIALAAGVASCIHSPTHVVDLPPARLNPLEGAIVLELDVPDWQEICVRAQPAESRLYHCLQLGQLRASLEQYRRAKQWNPFLASWGGTWAVRER